MPCSPSVRARPFSSAARHARQPPQSPAPVTAPARLHRTESRWISTFRPSPTCTCTSVRPSNCASRCSANAHRRNLSRSPAGVPRPRSHRSRPLPRYQRLRGTRRPPILTRPRASPHPHPHPHHPCRPHQPRRDRARPPQFSRHLRRNPNKASSYQRRALSQLPYPPHPFRILHISSPSHTRHPRNPLRPPHRRRLRPPPHRSPCSNSPAHCCSIHQPRRRGTAWAC